MDYNPIIHLRFERQRLLTPAGVDDYDKLFRLMSPVHTIYWTEPGAPPVLSLRAAFDDFEYNNRRRAERKILKGRFQNGSVGYVDYRDLALYACAYRKEIPSLGFEELAMLDLLSKEGPLNIGTIKELTGMLVKKITPVLHKLQQAFLVFEDQIDSEGDRAWYLFSTEFPEIDLQKYSRTLAIADIIERFLSLMVLADADSIKSFFCFSAKNIKEALMTLLSDGIIQKIVIEEREHYYLTSDKDLIRQNEAPAPQGIFLLHRNDFLVKSFEYVIKNKFVSDLAGVLHYIVIDGEIKGAVMGRFKFGPHVIEDIVLDIPEAEKSRRKQEILDAVYEVFDPEYSPVKRYDGIPE